MHARGISSAGCLLCLLSLLLLSSLLRQGLGLLLLLYAWCR